MLWAPAARARANDAYAGPGRLHVGSPIFSANSGAEGRVSVGGLSTPCTRKPASGGFRAYRLSFVRPLSRPFPPFGQRPHSAQLRRPEAVVCYVRNTSEPAVRFASIGGVRLVATNVFLTSKAAAFFVQGL